MAPSMILKSKASILRTILLSLSLCILLTLGCGLGSGLATPSPTPMVESYIIEDLNSPSLDLRVFRSDAVVWVKPNSNVAAKVETVPSDPGVAPTYRAYIEFKFEVIEYVKGSGLKEVAARASSGYTQLKKADAQNTADRMLIRRDSVWEDREAVLFLQSLPTQAVSATDSTTVSHYSFMDWSYGKQADYQIDGDAKTWLPAQAMGASGQSNASSASKLFLADSEPAQPGGELPTVSLSEIRTSVSELTETMKKGKGIEGYEYCVHDKLLFISEMRDRDMPIIEYQMTSGLPAGSVLDKTDEYWFSGLGYGKRWLSGPDSDHFSIKIIDTEGRTLTDPTFAGLMTYHTPITSVRPLPAGVYKFHQEEQLTHEIPCNFIYPDKERQTVRGTVTAPIGVVHEAFFDPVNLTGGAIGADKDNGALKPTAFSVKGAATKIERIKWDSSGRVSMDLKPGVSLKGHLIEFIGLNGKPIRSLSFDRSAGTSAAPSWQVCDPPWKAGDLLMIRISAGATAFGEAAKVSPCPNAPTPTPTPKPPARGRG